MGTIALPARLTLAEAADAARALEAQVRAQPDALIDASALQVLDTSALSVLLACRRAALAAGGVFAIEHAPAKLQQLARLYGIETLLGLPAQA